MPQEEFNREVIERLTRIETKIEEKHANDVRIAAEYIELQKRVSIIEKFQNEQIGIWKVVTASGALGAILAFIVGKILGG